MVYKYRTDDEVRSTIVVTCHGHKTKKLIYPKNESKLHITETGIWKKTGIQ